MSSLLTGEEFLFNGEYIYGTIQEIFQSGSSIDYITIYGSNYRILCIKNDILIFDIPYFSIISIKKCKNNKKIYQISCRNLQNIFLLLHDKSKQCLYSRDQFWNIIISNYKTKSLSSLFCFSHILSTKNNFNGWNIFNITKEYYRMYFDKDSWIESNINNTYSICESYSKTIYLPKTFSDKNCISLSKLCILKRFPLPTYFTNTGGCLVRMSQLVDCSKGLKLLKLYANSFGNDILCMILTSSSMLISTSSLKKYTQYFNIKQINVSDDNEIINAFCDISHRMNVSNITQNILLENILWLKIIKFILYVSDELARILESGTLVFLQSYNGMNINSVISTLSQIIIDPYYRTFIGFCILIEKEFMYFGYNFVYTKDSSKYSIKDIDKYSVYFILLLDCIWQLLQWFPFLFEFNENLLYNLSQHIFSGQFGTFITNYEQQRSINIINHTPSYWSYIYSNSKLYKSSFFSPNKSSIKVFNQNRKIQIWVSYFYNCISSRLHDQKINNILYKRLDISSNQLKLSNLHITSIFKIIDIISKSLTHIDISYNLLTIIPSEFILFDNLLILNIQNNIISNITAFFDEYTKKERKLQRLDLSYNQISNIPDSILLLLNLKQLKLKGNQILYIPSLEYLNKLQELDISENIINDLPLKLPKNISSLKIGNNPINLQISNLYNLNNLIELDISSFENIKLKNIIYLTNLTSLDLSMSILVDSLDPIFKLTLLCKLSLSYCKLDNIPLNIYKLNNLEYFDISFNMIKELDKSLCLLESLTYLDCSYNQINIIHTDIHKLIKLKYLYLNDNKLTELLYEIGNLQSLEELHIEHNNIKNLPISNRKLTKLQMSGNFYFDKEIISCPTDSIKDIFLLFDNNLEGNNKTHHLNLYILGNNNVGKTTLINNLTKYNPIDNNLFNNECCINIIEDYKILFKKKSYKYREPIFNIYYNKGNNEYRFIQELSFTNSGIYIIVWNITQKESFNNVEYWLKLIKSKYNNVPIILIATHIENIKENKKENIFNKIIEKYSNKYNISDILEISNNNEKLISNVKNSILSKTFKHIYYNSIYPHKYFEFKKLILQKRYKSQHFCKIISFNIFSQWAKLCNIQDYQDIINVALFLHNEGIILYFYSIESLHNIIFLHPQYIFDFIDTFISKKHNYCKKGILIHYDLPHILNILQLSESYSEECISLLDNLELLCYLRSLYNNYKDIPNALYRGMSIIPNYLPKDKPKIINQLIEQYYKEYTHIYKYYLEFKIISDGFLSSLYNQIFKIIDPLYYWRYGLLLTNSSNIKSNYIHSLLENYHFSIIIDININNNSINLLLFGNVYMFISWFFNCIDYLIKRNNLSLSYCKLIPCNICNLENKISYINIKELYLAKKQCNDIIECSNLHSIFPYTIDINLQYINTYEKIKELYNTNKEIIYSGKYNNTDIIIRYYKDITTIPLIYSKILFWNEYNHSHIISLKGITDNFDSFICENIQLYSLESLINDKTKYLSWNIIYRIAMDITKVMKYLHNQNPPIIHKSLQSSSIYIQSLNENDKIILKFADIGIEEPLIEETHPLHLAPEIIEKKSLFSKQSDIFSFGLILYELAERKKLFHNVKYKQNIENNLIKGQRPILSDSIPKEFVNLINKCWCNNKRPSFNNIYNILKNILESIYTSDKEDIYLYEDIQTNINLIPLPKIYEKPIIL